MRERCRGNHTATDSCFFRRQETNIMEETNAAHNPFLLVMADDNLEENNSYGNQRRIKRTAGEKESHTRPACGACYGDKAGSEPVGER